jgi:hypothetical protein
MGNNEMMLGVDGTLHIVNATQLARHFGITTTHIRRLAKEAIISSENGKYDQDKSRLAYIAHLRSQRNIKAEGDASYRKLKNRKLQLELAQMDGRLIDLDEALLFSEHLVASFRRGLDGLARKAPRRLTFNVSNCACGRIKSIAIGRPQQL